MGVRQYLYLGLLVTTTHICSAQTVVTSVVPKGDGAPVRIGDSGRAYVMPTAAKDGVSYNGFNQFDVGKQGLTFENQAVNARTIVAEVFSAAPSRIQGDLEVAGPRANFILANQNGISLNGTNLVNFGSVAFTTGAISLRDQQQSAGHTQRFVDLATGQGTIQIGDQGIAGNLIRLEMIAKNIEVNGCWRRSKSEPPCRVNSEPGVEADA